MKNRPFGLDIGSTTIKLVSLERKKNGFLLDAALMYPTPLKGMLSESPFDQEEMAQMIKKIVLDSKVTSQYVNIALAEQYVYTKVIEMPVLSDKELSSAIYWEAEQHIPVPLKTITLDWKVLRRPMQSDTNQVMIVLLVGAASQTLEKYQKILTMAGLFINSVETEILSVSRVLTYQPTWVEDSQFPPSMIVHIGTASTSLVIVSQGIILFTYSLPVGGAAINRAIAADFGFSVAQAEEYKKAYGVSDKVLGGKIGKSTEPILTSVLNEVKKALSFYSEKQKDSPITQILLSGGTAKLPGIDLFFAKNCGIETITANPWKVLSNNDVPKDILESAPDYTTAVGLAIRDNG